MGLPYGESEEVVYTPSDVIGSPVRNLLGHQSTSTLAKWLKHLLRKFLLTSRTGC